jgi:hypothetical protein
MSYEFPVEENTDDFNNTNMDPVGCITDASEIHTASLFTAKRLTTPTSALL